MKCTAFLTLLTGLGALCLQFVVLFGGYNTTTLTNLYMFNINITKISHTNFNYGGKARNDSNGNSSSIEWVNGTLTIGGHEGSDKNSTQDGVTYQLPLDDFYNVYLMNTCGGKFLSNGSDGVITECKKPSPTHRFDLTKLVEDALDKVQKQLNEDISLEDLSWPDGIKHAFNYVKQAYTAMVFFFVISLTFSLVAVLAGSVGIFSTHKFTNMVVIIGTTLSFFSLLVCAGLSTAINTEIVNGITTDGDKIGVTADSGGFFLAMAWIAASLLFISTISAIAEACVGGAKHRPKRGGNKGYRKARSADGAFMVPSFMAAPSMPHPASYHSPFHNPFAQMSMPSMHSMGGFSNPFSAPPMMPHPGFHGGYQDPYASRHSLLRPMADYDDEDFR